MLAGIKEKGISMVEMLIVAGMISVLATVVVIIVNPLGTIGKANDAKRKSDLAQLKRGLEIYYQDYGRYPAHTVGTYLINDGGSKAWGAAWPPYMQVLPRDPKSGRTYIYFSPNSGSCTNNQCYYVFSSLEMGGGDTQSCFPGTNNACAVAVANGLSNSCGGVCNYGISSPNTTP